MFFLNASPQKKNLAPTFSFRLCGCTVRVWLWKARLALVRQRLYILVSVFKISVSIILAVLLVPDFTFTLTFPRDLTTSLTPDNSSGEESDLHLRQYGPLYTMLGSGVLCSYMSGLACKLCMQVGIQTTLLAVVELVCWRSLGESVAHNESASSRNP